MVDNVNSKVEIVNSMLNQSTEVLLADEEMFMRLFALLHELKEVISIEKIPSTFPNLASIIALAMKSPRILSQRRCTDLLFPFYFELSVNIKRSSLPDEAKQSAANWARKAMYDALQEAYGSIDSVILPFTRIFGVGRKEVASFLIEEATNSLIARIKIREDSLVLRKRLSDISRELVEFIGVLEIKSLVEAVIIHSTTLSGDLLEGKEVLDESFVESFQAHIKIAESSSDCSVRYSVKAKTSFFESRNHLFLKFISEVVDMVASAQSSFPISNISHILELMMYLCEESEILVEFLVYYLAELLTSSDGSLEIAETITSIGDSLSSYVDFLSPFREGSSHDIIVAFLRGESWSKISQSIQAGNGSYRSELSLSVQCVLLLLTARRWRPLFLSFLKNESETTGNPEAIVCEYVLFILCGKDPDYSSQGTCVSSLTHLIGEKCPLHPILSDNF